MWIILSIIILPLILNGQMARMTFDQAQKKLENITPSKAKCDSIIMYSKLVFRSYDMKGTEKLIIDGLKLAEELNYFEKIPKFYLELSNIKNANKQYREAVNLSLLGLKKSTSTESLLYGELLFKLTRYYQKWGKVDSMMFYFALSKSWNDKHDATNNWILYESLSDMFEQQNDLTQAYKYSHKAYSITKVEGKLSEHGVVLYSLLSITSKLNKSDLYDQYLDEYCELYKKKGKEPSIHGLPMEFGGTVDEKIKSYLKLKNNPNLLQLPDFIPNINQKLSYLYTEKKDSENALKFHNKIDTSDFNDLSKSEYLYQKYLLNKKNKSSDQALLALESYMVVKDSLSNADKVNYLRDIETRYETKIKEDKIAFLNKMDEIKTNDLKKATRDKWILTGLLALLFLFFIATIYLMTRLKKTNGLLEVNNHQLSKTLGEKDILLKEIHHRVKNNLQVVCSLLSLQGNYIDDKNALKAINEGKDRVNSMALIHQHLYTKENLTAIGTNEYFSELIDQLIYSYNAQEKNVDVTLDIDNFMLDVDEMVPLGLITNELISNAFKHGVPNSPNPKIHIALKKNGNEISLLVKDNGLLFNKEQFATSNSFGNNMISAFAKKLKGQLVLDDSNGAAFYLKFITVKGKKLAA